MHDLLEVDPQTLSDLEIFPDGAEERGLFPMLDRARTRGGRHALRARLGRPLAGAGAIRAVQDALRFLPAHDAACRAALDPDAMDAVERYLRSRYSRPGDPDGRVSPIAARWTALRFPDLAAEARRGATAVASVAESALAFCAAMRGGAPAVLSEIARRLEEPARDLAAIPGRGGAAADLQRDALLRGPLRGAIERCLEGLHELDALRAMAVATGEHGWTFPEIVDGPGCTLRRPGSGTRCSRARSATTCGWATGRCCCSSRGPTWRARRPSCAPWGCRRGSPSSAWACRRTACGCRRSPS